MKKLQNVNIRVTFMSHILKFFKDADFNIE